MIEAVTYTTMVVVEAMTYAVTMLIEAVTYTTMVVIEAMTYAMTDD